MTIATAPSRGPARRVAVALACVLALLAAAAARPDEPRAWADAGDQAGLLAALDHQIAYLKHARGTPFPLGGRTVSTADLLRAATAFRDLVRERYGAPAFADELRRRFDVVAVTPPERPGLVTGYFVPELRASAAPSLAFREPIHGLPPELRARGVVGPTREQIDRGALAGRGLEIAWTDDALALYWLHVQGSGVLVFPDGARRAAHYAGDNGRPYVSIGATLVADGRLTVEEATLPGIEAWLRAHPGEMDEALRRNPRYIFFALDRGPVRGAGNIPLTPMRSVAADPAALPLGCVGWLDYATPAWNGNGERLPDAATGRFVLVQDAGAAIKGPGRIDLFTGFGNEARRLAGYLRHAGTVYLLLAKP